MTRIFRPVEPLTAQHEAASFDCGADSLNRFLQRHALASQQANCARTYVACRVDQAVVCGFYSLAVGAVEPTGAPTRVTRGPARHPVPVMLLARLAVDIPSQGIGLGKVSSKMRC